jgi:hypothetical protein
MINGQGKLRRYYPAQGFKGWMLQFGHMPPHPSFYASRSAFATIGLFDEQLSTGADFEWMVRFFHKHRLRARFIGDTLIAFRTGGITNHGLRSRIAINREAEISCKRHGILTHRSLLWAKYLVKVLQYVIRPPDFPLPRSQYWAPNRDDLRPDT